MSDMPSANRRDLLIAPLLAAIPAALFGDRAYASPIDPNMTFTRLPDQIVWQRGPNRPPNTVEQASLWSKSSEPGLYYYLVRWYPGFMSGPHWYESDRLCVVVSGTWWVASGKDFNPSDTVPMPAGSFIRRVARTPHYDGVKRRKGARGDRDLRYGTDHLSRRRSKRAGAARVVSEKVDA
jgi:hypothetical protein